VHHAEKLEQQRGGDELDCLPEGSLLCSLAGLLPPHL
jgi:hypothetical protein